MSPAQVLGQLKSAEIKIYSDNLRHCTNWSKEICILRPSKTSSEQTQLDVRKKRSLESLGIIVRKDAKNLALDLSWSSSVTCSKASNLRSRQLVKKGNY